MEEKYFRIIWNNLWSTTEYIRGNSISDALTNSGYDESELSNINNWNEASVIPIKNKEVIILNWDNTPRCKFLYNQHTNISDAIRKMIDDLGDEVNPDDDTIELDLTNSIYQYKISIKPFQIICRLMYYESGNTVKS